MNSTIRNVKNPFLKNKCSNQIFNLKQPKLYSKAVNKTLKTIKGPRSPT